MFESASGQEALVLGKPSSFLYRTVLEELGLPAADVTATGDDIHTDIIGARDAGIRTVLVRTGKYRTGDEDRVKPDRTVSSLLQALENSH